MRIVKSYDSDFKLVGVGLQWGRPLTVVVRDMAGHTLGAMLNYGKGRKPMAAASIDAETRVLLPICEKCKQNHAVLWCRSHATYLCDVCVTADRSEHRDCEFYSLAVKEAMRAVNHG